MKRISVAGCLLLFLAGTSLAEATDLQITRAPPFLPPPLFSWTGFYLGGNVGAGFGWAREELAAFELIDFSGRPAKGFFV
jgi:outer membrane immunogenic protein